MKKRIMAAIMAALMASTLTVSVYAEGETFVIIDKSLTDWNKKEIAGFTSYVEENGGTALDKSVMEISVSNQVQAMDEAITLGAAAIAVNCNGDTGYDQVVKKAVNAGVKVCSFDAKLSPENRLVHINQTTNQDAGEYMLRLGVMAALEVEYSGDDMVAALESALAEYDGPEINLGVISAGVDSPIQNEWLKYMNQELEKDMYQGKVNSELDIKYGNDDVTESTTQAAAFLAEDKVDVIICISGAAPPAVAAAFEGSDTDIKFTGCGLPSQCQSFMPKADEEYFSTNCPYILLWDVTYMCAVAGAVSMAAVNDGYDGSVGAEVTVQPWGNYEETTFVTEEAEDGGTQIILGAPIVFDKNNVAEWAGIL